MKITCKKCRRLGVSVCSKFRCALGRKPYPPGKSPRPDGGKGRRFGTPLSDYGRQLRAKQILKFTYGLRERQFKNYALKSMSSNSESSTARVIDALESRLDNVVFRLNFASSRASARQMVSHGHIFVNNKKVNIPSFRVRIGDIVSVRPQSREKAFLSNFQTIVKKYQPPEWLKLDKEQISGLIIGKPKPESPEQTNNINTVIEFYSR